MSPTLELRTLGGPDLRGRAGDDTSAVLARPKDLAILVYLGVATPFGFHRRDILLPLFWPESDQEHARGALSQSLYRLRRDLGEDVIRGRGQEEVGISDRALRVDVRAFERALDEGNRVEALRLYRGTLLEGFHVPGSRGFERWLDARQAQLRRAAVTAAAELADTAEKERNPAGAARWLQRAQEISPLEETILRRLLRALSQAGDRAGALQAYEAFDRRIRREYELEPAEETRALVGSIRRGEATGPVKSAGYETEPGDVRAPAASSASGSAIRSLAVLPFRTRPDSSNTAVFADGVTEALIGDLGHIGALRMISLQTVDRYRGAEIPVEEIGRELGVDALIGGSVSRSADRLEIRVRLTRIHPEEQLWAKRYRRDVADMPRVHGEIARDIVGAVGVRLTEDERAHFSVSRSVDPDAYAAYLKGRHFALIPGAIDRALDYFHEAARHDPAYAPPYAGIAITHGNLALYAFTNPADSGPLARRAVDQALALDPGSSDAHAARALVLALFDHDWEEAEREMRRALRLNPGNSLAWSYLGSFLASMGCFEEASAAAREATTLDPAGPWTNFTRAWTAYRSRRLEAARDFFRETLDLYPRIAICHGFLAAILFLLERPDEAVDEVEAGLAKTPSDQIILGYGANVVGRVGCQTRSRELVERLESMRSDRYVDPFYLAAARLGVGDEKGALDALEDGVRRSVAALFLNTDPLFDRLRAHDRFRAVTEELDFPRIEKGTAGTSAASPALPR